MQDQLKNFIPKAAIQRVTHLLENDKLLLKIKKERKTRHGDFKSLSNGQHQISINANLNPYRFLLTLIHEIAHYKAYSKHGPFIKPHGQEWKRCFQQLMLPFLNPEVFPDALLPLLAKHFKNPKASSDTDIQLARAMKHYDFQKDKRYVYDIPEGSAFKLYNGKIFQKGNKRIKRYECIEIKTGKLYLFNPNAEVELIKI